MSAGDLDTGARSAGDAAGREPRFPFTAIVGQTPMKRALLLNAINPRIGGVLVRGKKGTAKSTAVRSLAALLPQVPVVPGCPYSCTPGAPQEVCDWCRQAGRRSNAAARQVRIVDLPVGATEDRLVGALDIEQAIKSGAKNFEPGLIAAAHRGILYIDEVNLLNDHLVDVLLDAAAMGRNYVEREGISVSHAAEFMLVGTMNPEEGDLRPQLLDRFGLAVEVDGVFAPAERREVVRRRMSFEAAPFDFMDAWAADEQAERARIIASQQRLAAVAVPDAILELITDICAEYQVDGLRGDIVMYKTASTIAAYEGRTVVGIDDVREAALMALLHRQRRQPFQQPHLVTEQLDQMLDDFQNQPRNREPADGNDSGPNDDRDDGDSDSSSPDDSPEPPAPDDPESDDNSDDNDDDDGAGNAADSGLSDEWYEVGDPYAVQNLPVQPPDRRARRASGRRAVTVSGDASGRYVGARVPDGPASDLALDATLRAAAPYQQSRRQSAGAGDGNGDGADNDDGNGRAAAALLVEPWDIREKVRETHTGSLILFVVDASGSMGAQRRMVAVKGAVMSLLLDAYQRRDRVGLIAFRGTAAQLLLPPTGSVEMAQWRLQDLPTGGRTPLAHGIYLALETLETERRKDREVLPLLALLTDGRANITLAGAPAASGSAASGTAALGSVASSPAPADEVNGLAQMVADAKIPAVVIDTEQDFIRLELARPIADAMAARYIKLDELAAGGLADVVRSELVGQPV